MKGTSTALVAHMGASGTTISHIVKITRKDGVVFAFTDHDRDIVFGGVTYSTLVAADLSDVEMTAALNVDNLEATGFLDPAGITEESVVAGLWDFAAVRVSRVNWADLSMGEDKVKSGFLGQITLGPHSFTSEIRGLTQKLQQNIGEVYSPSCKANLFDARCKVPATEGVWKFSGVAVGVLALPQRSWASGGLTQPADFFTAGHVDWTTGANAGLSKEIKSHTTGGVIELQEPMPYAIAVGDTFVIYAGCQKRWELDCIDKFDNGVNFRGFPFIPGEDLTLRGY